MRMRAPPRGPAAAAHGRSLFPPRSFQLQHGLPADVRQQQAPVLRARGVQGLRHRLLLQLRRRLHGERAAVRRRRYAVSLCRHVAVLPCCCVSMSLSPCHRVVVHPRGRKGRTGVVLGLILKRRPHPALLRRAMTLHLIPTLSCTFLYICSCLVPGRSLSCAISPPRNDCRWEPLFTTARSGCTQLMLEH